MPMKVEAAVVTQKRPSAEFNTDSVNINGKVFSRDVIKNGYRGSGIISGSSYFALVSSSVEGFADAAVNAFNDRAEIFSVSKDVRSVFSGFYEDCRSALIKMDRNEDELVAACLYAGGRKVVLSHNGNARLFAQRLNICTPVTAEKAENTVADYNSSVFPDVAVGDIFILLSPGTAAVLSEKEIEDVCRIADGSVKRIVSLIYKVALAKVGLDAISVIAVKVLETELDTDNGAVGFVPDFSGIEEKAPAAQESAEESTDKAENPVVEANEKEEKTQVLSAEDNSGAEQVSEAVIETEEVSSSEEMIISATPEEDKTVELAEDVDKAEAAEIIEVVEAVQEVEAVDTENTAEAENVSADDTEVTAEVIPEAEEKQDAVTQEVNADSEKVVSSFSAESIAAAIAASAREQYSEMLMTEELKEDPEAEEKHEESEKQKKKERRKEKRTRAKLFIALIAMLLLSVFLFVVIIGVRGLGGKDGNTKDPGSSSGVTASADESTSSEAEYTTDEEGFIHLG